MKPAKKQDNELTVEFTPSQPETVSEVHLADLLPGTILRIETATARYEIVITVEVSTVKSYVFGIKLESSTELGEQFVLARSVGVSQVIAQGRKFEIHRRGGGSKSTIETKTAVKKITMTQPRYRIVPTT